VHAIAQQARTASLFLARASNVDNRWQEKVVLGSRAHNPLRTARSCDSDSNRCFPTWKTSNGSPRFKCRTAGQSLGHRLITWSRWFARPLSPYRTVRLDPYARESQMVRMQVIVVRDLRDLREMAGFGDSIADLVAEIIATVTVYPFNSIWHRHFVIIRGILNERHRTRLKKLIGWWLDAIVMPSTRSMRWELVSSHARRIPKILQPMTR